MAAEGDFFTSMDIQLAFSYVLSTITILSCVFLKIPQIQYIQKKRSAQGIYIQAMLMEIIGFTIVTLYNYTNRYSVMTYLEYPIILFQIYVLMYYTLKYKRLLGDPAVPLATAAYVATVTLFGLGIVNNHWLSYLIPMVTPLSGFAKVTYIFGIVKAGNADAVSPTTWYISIATNSARLFTVYVDSADARLLFNLAVSTLLSTGVLATTLFYQHHSKAKVSTMECQRNDHTHTDREHDHDCRRNSDRHEHDD